MELNELARPRLLFPRWRSLARTPSHEISGPREKTLRNGRKPRARAIAEHPTVSAMRRALSAWREEETLSNASDVLDAALVSGDMAGASSAATFVATHQSAVPALKRAAREVLGLAPSGPIPMLPPPEDRKTVDVHRAIHGLKKRLHDSPRDSISCVEIARLYSLIGQNAPAEIFIDRALLLERNNTFVLRSASRFFGHVGDFDKGLEMLWRTESVRHDPLVQSAELALAQGARRSPKWATRSLKAILASSISSDKHTELSCGLIGYELNGTSSSKDIRRLAGLCLRSPTENALAQLVTYNVSSDVTRATQSIIASSPSAYEAQSREAARRGDFSEAASWTWRWLLDEPFAARPALVGAHLSSIYLDDSEQSLKFAEHGLAANPDDFFLTNAKILALAGLGKTDDARKLLVSLEGHRNASYHEPYVFAARGAVEFRSGRIQEGTDNYELALHAAQRLDDAALVAKAAIYWSYEEAVARAFDPDFVTGRRALIQGLLDRLPRADAEPLAHIWTAMVDRPRSKPIHLLQTQSSGLLAGEMSRDLIALPQLTIEEDEPVRLLIAN